VTHCNAKPPAWDSPDFDACLLEALNSCNVVVMASLQAFSQKMYELMGSQLGVEGDLHPAEEEPAVAAPSTKDSSKAAKDDADDDEEDDKEEL
jgi:hypothetical protein